jgi:pSer/pThr/pTyr-binding forkhead associated (FHA) protein
MTRLVFVEQRPMAGRILPVEGEATIGREGCDIVLLDPEVSRRHAVISLTDGSASIEDLGSMNGTFVNDARIEGPTVLSAGDTIRLGNTVWTVESPGGVTRVSTGPA